MVSLLIMIINGGAMARIRGIGQIKRLVRMGIGIRITNDHNLMRVFMNVVRFGGRRQGGYKEDVISQWFGGVPVDAIVIVYVVIVVVFLLLLQQTTMVMMTIIITLLLHPEMVMVVSTAHCR